MGFTAETRRQSFENIKPKRVTKHQEILDLLSDGRVMGDFEMAIALGYTDRNATAPRRNELEKMGKIEQVGKKICPITGKLVTAFRLVQSDPKCGSCRFWQLLPTEQDKSPAIQQGMCLNWHGRRLREQKACEEIERR